MKKTFLKKLRQQCRRRLGALDILLEIFGKIKIVMKFPVVILQKKTKGTGYIAGDGQNFWEK